jgi:uncharacterized protein
MVPGVTLFGLADIEPLAVGSAVLGSGGGGNPYVGALLLRSSMEAKGVDRISVTPFEQIDESDFLICSAGMGSPAIGIEKLPTYTDHLRAFKALESYVGRKATLVSPIEIGGINSLVPLVVASQSGLPVADGDGEGRAFPELQMTTLTGYGLSASPVCLTEERGNTLMINGISDIWVERLARAATVTFGGRAYVAIYPLEGREYIRGAIPGSLTHAVNIGRSLLEGIKHKDPEDALVKSCDARLIFTGKIVDVKRYNTRGFAIGYTIVDGLDDFAHDTMKVSFQNEYLLAETDDEGKRHRAAVTPDIISIHDMETLLPITTDSLRYGQRCKIFSIPVSRKWDFPGAQDLVGLDAFRLE